MFRLFVTALIIALGLVQAQAADMGEKFDATFKAQVKAAKADMVMLSPKDTYKLLQENPDITLIDVRDPDELKAMGKPDVKNYKHMSRGKLEPLLAKSGLDPEKPVVVFCKTAARAALAGKTLREYGFKTIYNSEGGMDKWLEEGLPSLD